MKKKKFTNGINQKDMIALLKPSPIYAFASILPLMLITVIGMVVAIVYYNLLIVVSLISGLLMFYRYLYIVNIRYTLTMQTLTVRKDILSRRYDNLELFRVKDYIVSQTVFQRIFRLMTVSLHTTDLTHSVLKMEGIPLSDITETIRDLVQKARINNRIFEIN